MVVCRMLVFYPSFFRADSAKRWLFLLIPFGQAPLMTNIGQWVPSFPPRYPPSPWGYSTPTALSIPTQSATARFWMQALFERHLTPLLSSGLEREVAKGHDTAHNSAGSSRSKAGTGENTRCQADESPRNNCAETPEPVMTLGSDNPHSWLSFVLLRFIFSRRS